MVLEAYVGVQRWECRAVDALGCPANPQVRPWSPSRGSGSTRAAREKQMRPRGIVEMEIEVELVVADSLNRSGTELDVVWPFCIYM